MSTSRLRLQKISAFLTCSLRIRRRSASRFMSDDTTTRCWATVAEVEAGGATEISFGLLRKASARRRISGAMVAEKNSVWRMRGSRLDDLLDIGDEPHVQHAVGFVDHQDLHVVQQNAAAARNGRSAGPAWRSARRRRGPAPSPGRRTRRRRSAAPSRACNTCRICQSSGRPRPRVRGSVPGSSERGMRALARPSPRISIIGRVKPAVLPVPVWAHAQHVAAGQHDGDGLRLDRGVVVVTSVTERTTSGPKPSVSKLI